MLGEWYTSKKLVIAILQQLFVTIVDTMYCENGTLGSERRLMMYCLKCGKELPDRAPYQPPPTDPTVTQSDVQRPKKKRRRLHLIILSGLTV